jgi:hypothetical protein
MGLFKKKTDPISDRARQLKAEISALEGQIQQLTHHLEQQKAQPRLRSTAMPHSPPMPQSREPIFEKVDQVGISTPEPESSIQNLDGAEKPFILVRIWNHIIGWFRTPPPANPKLLNLLAAGNIQGLRPLRYEKRVERNRFIFLVAIFLLMLWGIIDFFIRNH